MNPELEKYKEIYFSDIREHLRNMNKSFVELEHEPWNIDLLNEIFRAVHTIKGNSALMEYDDVAHLAHEMENLLDNIRNKEIIIDQAIMDTLFESFDAIEAVIGFISNNEEVIDTTSIDKYPDQLSLVKTKAIDKSKVKKPENGHPINNTNGETKKTSVSPLQTVQNIRFKVQQLDSLMNHIGELMISTTTLEHIASKYEIPELTGSVAHINRTVKELQKAVKEIQMVHVDHIFNKYPRIIRDLSKSRNKKVRLVIEGGDIKLDRYVLDSMNGPLVHILRNCVDHGIETVKERIDAGKPEKGTILLKVTREIKHVNIEISDDGAGINPDMVRESVISGGLMSYDDATEMSDDELFCILFQPGFSTAKAITDISGRGMGMDVVKRVIDRLGGSINIYSTPGKGTKIRLKLPLTLAIIE